MTAQFRNNFANFPLLEQPDSGDPGGASLDATSGILHCDPAEREDGNFLAAGLPQCIEARRRSVQGGFLFENRTEDGEISAFRRGSGNFRCSMAGDANGYARRSLP